MAVGSGHEMLSVLMAMAIYVTMAISEWPVLTRLAQYGARRQARAAGSQPCPPPPESEASDNPPTAK
jgi:hypothetical protein